MRPKINQIDTAIGAGDEDGFRVWIFRHNRMDGYSIRYQNVTPSSAYRITAAQFSLLARGIDDTHTLPTARERKAAREARKAASNE